MQLLTNANPLALWQDVIKQAENRCEVMLKQELEAYLATLLNRYTNQPELIKQTLAKGFLAAQQQTQHERQFSLQVVGDQCLLFAGLFPATAEKRLVSIGYFVEIGRSAYSSISSCANDLFQLLAMQFVVLMDVLQSIREYPDLLPLQAYDQWQEVGSLRALRILRSYSKHNGI